MDKGLRGEGNISEWNEGNFKNLRLHEAQELINSGKLDPLARTMEGRWNYNMWIAGITILYGEGQSKYSEEEIKDVEMIKSMIDDHLALFPPHITVIKNLITGRERKNSLDTEKFNKLKKLIELYEQKVKYFNDIHGLSTKNYDYDDEGL